MKYKVAIFDFDGTLVNSIKGIAKAVNETLKVLGKKEYTIKEVETFVGYGAEVLFLKAFKLDKLDATSMPLYNLFMANYLKYQIDNLEVYEGINGLLKDLNEVGTKIIIYSNKPDKILKACCHKLWKNIEFFGIFGNDVGFVAKPDCTMIKEFLDKNNINVKDVIYAGDSRVDILFGKNLGCDVISCGYGYNDKNVLLAEKPTYFIEKSVKLRDILL